MIKIKDSPTLEEMAAFFRSAGSVDAMLAAQCGKLASFSCLCTPGMLEVAEAFLTNYSEAERQYIQNAICGCTVTSHPTPPQATSPTGYVPAVYTPENQAPSTPTQSCPQGMPAKGSYS